MFLLNHIKLTKQSLLEKQTCMCPNHTSELTILYSLKGTAFYCISCFYKVCRETIIRELNYVFQENWLNYTNKPKNMMCLSCCTVVFMKKTNPCPKCGFTRWASVDWKMDERSN